MTNMTDHYVHFEGDNTGITDFRGYRVGIIDGFSESCRMAGALIRQPMKQMLFDDLSVSAPRVCPHMLSIAA